MGFTTLRDMTASISDEDLKKFEQAAEAACGEKTEQEEKPKKKKTKAVSDKTANSIACQRPKKTPANKDRFSAEEPEEETVTLSVHKSKMDALQKKLDTLTEKYKKLNEEKKKISKELTASNKNYASEKKKRESLEEKNRDLNKKFNETDKDLRELNKLLKDGKAEYDDVKNEIIEKNKTTIDDLKKQIKALEEEKVQLTEDKQKEIDRNAELAAEIGSKNEEIEKLSKELKERPVQETPADTGMTISRISPTEFQSALFTGSRYRVNLARDCSYISFRIDILGKASCSGGVISLPQISAYIPFKGKKDYTASAAADGSYTVSLIS